MAHRSYLYSINQIPTEPRLLPPKGISEWRSEVPFTYQVLMSENPQLCPSRLSSGLDTDEPGNPTDLWALYAPRKPGYLRLKKLFAAFKALPEVPPPWREPYTKVTTDRLHAEVDEAEAFLAKVTYPYLLLEVIELQLLSYDPSYGSDYLAQETEYIASLCSSAGKAVDALPDDPIAAAQVLSEAVVHEQTGPLRSFYGLRFDEYTGGFDTTGLGMYWSDILFFSF